MDRVKGKVAIVTGGAKGIGKSACLHLAAQGAQVAVTDVAEEEGRQVTEEIRAQDGEAEFWTLDVSDESGVMGTFAEVVDRFGHLDVLVNNAGISGANKPTDRLTQEEWEAVQRINTLGVFLCTKHAIPHMRAAGGGSIINLSSIYGIVSAPDVPSYHASKGAVRLMTKTDALLYAGDRIRVNSVHPGFIWTPMVRDFAKKSGEEPDAFREQVSQRHPIGHVGEPEDVAYGILYLASDEAKFVTGSELVIDGGYTAS
ncbi:MAG: glucose 1-dehydrogenase [Candidatus Eisenbacteria bacterium]|nr:glucose 1-dehydrogenase [Candidatus Eisenbacteria bacterium]